MWMTLLSFIGGPVVSGLIKAYQAKHSQQHIREDRRRSCLLGGRHTARGDRSADATADSRNRAFLGARKAVRLRHAVLLRESLDLRQMLGTWNNRRRQRRGRYLGRARDVVLLRQARL